MKAVVTVLILPFVKLTSAVCCCAVTGADVASNSLRS
jgi:hypothetical protein